MSIDLIDTWKNWEPISLPYILQGDSDILSNSKGKESPGGRAILNHIGLEY